MSRIIKGMKSGLGFGLAFLVLLYFGLGFVLDKSGPDSGFSEKFVLGIAADTYSPTQGADIASDNNPGKVPFGELTLDDQIKYASVIAIAENRRVIGGRIEIVVTEIIKKKEGVTHYFDVGDRYRRFYPEDNVDYGDGSVMFFTGSPASVGVTMTYRNGLVSGLENVTVNSLREKCTVADT